MLLTSLVEDSQFWKYNFVIFEMNWIFLENHTRLLENPDSKRNTVPTLNRINFLWNKFRLQVRINFIPSAMNHTWSMSNGVPQIFRAILAATLKCKKIIAVSVLLIRYENKNWKSIGEGWIKHLFFIFRNTTDEKSTWLVHWNSCSCNCNFYGLGKTTTRTACKEKSATNLVLINSVENYLFSNILLGLFWNRK